MDTNGEELGVTAIFLLDVEQMWSEFMICCVGND